MTDIAALTSSATSNAARAATGLADNYETFLTLLTAQLQNQDPLNPVDSTEFTNQLVQFTNVEQQIEQNRQLEQLISLQRANAGSAAVGYLGKSGVAITDQGGLVNGQASWTYELGSDATEVNVVIRDPSGNIVAASQGQTTKGIHTVNWNGRTIAGNQLPDGTGYTLEVEALNGNGDRVTTTISQKGLITGVDLSGTTPRVTINGASVDLGSITRLTATASTPSIPVGGQSGYDY